MSMKRKAVASQLAEMARRRGNVEASNLALSAAWDFEYAFFADQRGDRNKARTKRGSANRYLAKARELLGITAAKV